MDEIQILQLTLQAVSGPASGVAVALLSMGGFGYFLVRHLLPSHEKQLDKVLDDSKENRKTFQEAVKVMSERLDVVEDDIKEVKIEIRSRL